MSGIVSLQMIVETWKVANEMQKTTSRILSKFSIFENIPTLSSSDNLILLKREWVREMSLIGSEGKLIEQEENVLSNAHSCCQAANK